MLVKSVGVIILCALCFGCKTIPQTSGGGSSSGSSGSTSSGSSTSGSSSGNSGSSAGLPGGGSYDPFPSSSGSQPKAGKDNREGGPEKGKGKQREGGDKTAGAGGGATEDRTLSEALEEFERARKRGDATGSEEQEMDFPIELEVEDEVAGEAIEKMEGFPEGKDDQQGGADGEGESVQTGEEKIAVLDRRLEESYGEFEGVILREREYVRGKENARGSRTDMDPESEEPGVGDTPAEDQPRGDITGSGSGNRPAGGDQREGDFEHTAVAHAPPPDIPDGTDDDVVARQLREAAMQEPDPELREKLWEEYRKYKNEVKRN